MKQKLGIFGDSYTQPNPLFDNYGFDPSRLSDEINDIIFNQKFLTKEKCWSYNPILTDHYDIVNYGKGGSDIIYSFDHFTNYHHLYDKIVFVVTAPSRIGFNYKDQRIHISQFDDINETIKYKIPQWNNRTDVEKNYLTEVLCGLEKCWPFIMDDKIYQSSLIKLVEIVKTVRPDSVIIMGFSVSAMFNKFSILKTELENIKLFDISRFELNSVGIENFKNAHYDGRNAHMSNENNLIFAEYIRLRLLGENPKLSLNDFEPIRFEEKEIYFPKVNYL